MKKLIFALWLVLLSVSLAWAQPGPRPGLLIEESDGSPSGFIYKLIVPSTELAISSAVGTLTFGMDTDGNGTVDLDEIGNPGANKTFTMANYTLKFDYTTDDPSTITFIEYEFDCLATDTDVVFFWLQADANGTPVDLMKITGTATRATMTGDLTINTTQTNYSTIDNYKVNNVSLNDLDMGFTVAQTFNAGVNSPLILGSDITGNGSISVANLNKMYQATAAATVTLPDVDGSTVVYGDWVGFRVRDAAETLTIEIDNGDKINLHGTALDAGDTIDSPGNAGDFIFLMASTDTDGSGTDGWVTLGYGTAVWTDGDAT